MEKIKQIISPEKIEEIKEIAELVSELAVISTRLKELNVICKITIK